jgi:hypothetical protein
MVTNKIQMGNNDNKFFETIHTLTFPSFLKIHSMNKTLYFFKNIYFS